MEPDSIPDYTIRSMLHLVTFEELLDDPHEGVVVLRSVHLGHESPSLSQVLSCNSQGMESDLVLLVGVFLVGRSNVGSAIAQHHVCLYMRGKETKLPITDTITQH